MLEKTIYLRRSKQYIIILIFFHVLATCALLITPLEYFVLLSGLFILLISFIICVYIYWHRFLYLVTIGATFSDLVIENSQKEVAVQLLASSVVTEFYICIHCKEITGKKKYFYVLMRDSFNTNEDLRILASWMKQAFI